MGNSKMDEVQLPKLHKNAFSVKKMIAFDWLFIMLCPDDGL
jgi:hypothetical protein